jgi:tetratricopeptide (TPR) repeat protein
MPFDAPLHTLDADASVLMKRGLRLLRESRPKAIAEALTCFDDALALRRRLPIETVPVFAYGLAACWLNRADALMRLGQIQPALDGFDEAIVLLRTLPLGEDPRFVRRLVIACQNRGLVLQVQGRLTDAINAFSDVISIFDQAQEIADRDYLLAAVYANLANAHAADETAQSDWRAREAAIRAIGLVANLEATDADAAEVGLKARHALCHVIARCLLDYSGSAPSDDVHEATDLADDGLSLVRRWEQKSVTRFRDLALDLFRFGARVYAKYQPQFLPEFLVENMDPARSSPDYVSSPEMQSVARHHFACGAQQTQGFEST